MLHESALDLVAVGRREISYLLQRKSSTVQRTLSVESEEETGDYTARSGITIRQLKGNLNTILMQCNEDSRGFILMSTTDFRCNDRSPARLFSSHCENLADHCQNRSGGTGTDG